ncbi:TPA: hypothetical protein R4039_004100 [Citrobacter freundii]|nr:hypothetical protein [Citrobacter freundii]
MPWQNIDDSQTGYFLLSVDKQGKETLSDVNNKGEYVSSQVINVVKHEAITDLFLWVHGWQQDPERASSQFDSWIGAFKNCTYDRLRVEASVPHFRSLHIGFHWPSLAWANESLKAVPFGGAERLSRAMWVEQYTLMLGNEPGIRQAIENLFDVISINMWMDTLPDDVCRAYLALNEALALGENGCDGDGAADRHAFEPRAIVESVPGFDNFAIGGLGDAILLPLRQLTFWAMKKRAKVVGENGLYPFIVALQRSAPELRIHLMGHSFGCIVASAGIAGPEGNAPLNRSIQSCALVQGAMSIWAFAPTNEYTPNTPGYFYSIIADKKVSGPLVCTFSAFDYAVGRLYPWAAGVANQIAFDQPREMPRYAGIGTWGIQGVTNDKPSPMLEITTRYVWENSSVIYNIDGGKYICKIDGISGAHSDIGGPEVAHLIWQTAFPEANNE